VNGLMVTNTMDEPGLFLRRTVIAQSFPVEGLELV
jgi:hypothetical protein